MYCPQCQSDSPLVALQPDGLVCARCQTEVVLQDASNSEFAKRPATDSDTSKEGCSSSEKWNRSKAKETRAPHHIRTKRRPQQQTALKLATVLDADASRQTSAAILRPSLVDDDFDDVSLLTNEPANLARSCEVATANAEKLFRFDSAHRTTDRAHHKDSQESTEQLFEAAALAIRTKPQSLPIPRTFLLLRSTNPWPSRWTFLSSALFIAGQSFLLWSIPRGLAWGVATGVLTSAWAFTMALYVIAQYCDDEHK